MGTPTNRTPVRVARGSTTALNTGLSDIQEGEIVWDTTLNRLQVKEGSVLENSVPASDATKADLASPAFTGTPAAPTAVANTNTTQVATTAYVQTELGDYAPLASPTLTGTPTVPGYATLASPTLTGTPASTTAAVSTNTTQIATTAFVQNEIGTNLQAYDADTAKLDVDQTWTGAQSGSIYDATSDATSAGAGWAIDFADGNNQKVTLVSTNLLSVIPTNQTVGQSGSIFITQPGSPLSLGWHADWKWAGGNANAPSLTQTGGATDRLDYVILAANTIHAVLTLAVA